MKINIQMLSMVCFIILFHHIDIHANDRGKIYGYILDHNTGKPIEKACVLLEPDSLGAETDADGVFFIPAVPPGEYELSIVMIGYEEISKNKIKVNPNEQKELNFFLSPIILNSSDQISVTATRGKSMTNEVPASVDVINAESIELETPQNMAEILDNVQGVFIKDYGGVGGSKTISLRGSSAEQVLVLLDGQRLNDAQSGQVDFSTLSLEGIEKIEVVRGGNSALYGADAVGGVINIITQKKYSNKGISGSLKIMNGSFQSSSFEPSLKFNFENIGGAVSYKYLNSEGDYPYENSSGVEEKKQNNDVEFHDIFSRLYFLFGNPHYQKTLNMSYKYYTSERGSPGTTELPYYSARLWNTSQQLNTTFSGKIMNLTNDLKIQSYIHTSNSRYKNDEGLVDVDSKYNNGTYGLETQLQTIFSANQALTYGAGYRYDWMTSHEFPEDHTRYSYYAFLQNETEFKFDNLPHIKSISIVPAIRYDAFTDFGSHISPKIGSVFNFGQEWRTSLKLNMGLNYRAPNFNELYWPEDAWTKGNTDLKAEQGYDWDIGFRLRYPILNEMALDMTYFDLYMNDLILWASNGQIWMPSNVNKSRNRGVETSISVSPIKDLFSIVTNYTFLDARNLSKDRTLYKKYLVYRPKHTFNTSLKFTYGDFTLKYDFQHVSRRYIRPANTLYLESYNISDLLMSFIYNYRNWKSTISFQVKNIFDEKYEIIQYQPIPGREYRVNMNISFN